MEPLQTYIRRIHLELSRPDVARYQLMTFIRISSWKIVLVHPSDLACECGCGGGDDDVYGRELNTIVNSRKQCTAPTGRGHDMGAGSAGNLVRRHAKDQAQIEPTRSRPSSPPPVSTTRKNQFKLISNLFTYFRVFTTVWMIYVVVRYNLSEQIDALLKRIIHLKMPIRCYLAGSYIITREFMNDITAAILSGGHLIWRAFHLYHAPYVLNVVNFMQLNDDELTMFYNCLDSSQCLELSIKEGGQLCRRQRFLLDLMCYKITKTTGITYRLRHNRSMSSRRQLCLAMSSYTLFSLAAFVSIASVFVSAFTFMIITDPRYVSVYRGCDPELDKLYDENKLHWWSVTPTMHRMYAATLDGFENIALWVEGGLVLFFVPCLVASVNHDLLLCWTRIEKKIELLSKFMSYKGEERIISLSRRSIVGQQMENRSDVEDLFAEMSDFFSQFRRANHFISVFLSSTLIGWLIVCAIYSYVLKERSISELPANIILMLTFFVIGVSYPYMVMLSLHRACVKFYPKLCSMMAYDPMKHRNKWEPILDFYLKRQSCYTIMGRLQFQSSTIVSIIGWTCSCFFIISGLMRDRGHLYAKWDSSMLDSHSTGTN
jgi:hypothetical protein